MKENLCIKEHKRVKQNICTKISRNEYNETIILETSVKKAQGESIKK